MVVYDRADAAPRSGRAWWCSAGAGAATAAAVAARHLIPCTSCLVAAAQWHRLYDEGGGRVPSLEFASTAVPADVPGKATYRCLRAAAWRARASPAAFPLPTRSSVWFSLQPPCTVRCCAASSLQSAYLECDGNNTAGTLVEDGLGELESPDGQGSVPAVFNWVTNGAALPGAIGTRGCDCEGAYGNGTLGALGKRGGLQGRVGRRVVEGLGNLRWSCPVATT